jgi:pimeloyl-ACP methyl ester carboxylesterase
VLIVLMTAFMTATQPEVSDLRVKAAGTDVAVRCMGNRAVGKPPVVLEAGGGAGFDTWSPVQSSIAEFVRVCGYDRPTLTRGTAALQTSSLPADVVRTLREVLSALGEAPPYIMVGHSYGGMIVRLYATRYPKEVSGLVLVDSTHEDLLRRFDQIDPEAARELRSPAEDEAVDLVAFHGPARGPHTRKDAVGAGRPTGAGRRTRESMARSAARARHTIAVLNPRDRHAKRPLCSQG